MASIREQIMAAIETRLGTISIANGYNNDIREVFRYTQDPSSLEKLPAIGIRRKTEATGFKYNEHVDKDLTIDITAFAHHPENTDGSSETISDSLIEDIEVAIAQDEEWSTLAMATDVLDWEDFPTEDGQALIGATLTMVIRYRHRIDNPALKV